MRVLIACEFSGVVREAFRKRGHDAWSCDLRPAKDGSPYHIIGDIQKIRVGGFGIFRWQPNWDLLIAHPPCQKLALCAARWQHDHWVKRKNKPDRWHNGSKHRAQRKEAVDFFRWLLNAPVEKRCIENPKSVASTLVAPMSQTIHPWQFGHMEQKTTWLWLRNLPPLKHTNNVHAEMMKLSKQDRERIFYMAPSEERESLRSITFQGIADAMADQWGGNSNNPDDY